ncbi:MAG: 3-ketoacyl-ACP reductase [Phycisphaera sp.]|nr:3-ketoacyl-ACP reductase [Phycisphaera sp.]
MSHQPVALVTGGGRGIGLGICEALAAEGWCVAFSGLRDASDVTEALERIEQHGGEAKYIRADVSVADDRQRAIDEIRSAFGRLDMLVNNAGITSQGRDDILAAGEASYDKVMDVNLKGPFFLTQLAANYMVEQMETGVDLRACVINISSISAQFISTNRGDYCLTKAAMGMLTQLWASRLGEYGIPVYEIQPGLIRTDMTAAVTEKYDRMIADGLLVTPRWGEPGDVGKAVAMLARGDLAYSTGQTLTIDGGMHIRRL